MVTLRIWCKTTGRRSRIAALQGMFGAIWLACGASTRLAGLGPQCFMLVPNFHISPRISCCPRRGPGWQRRTLIRQRRPHEPSCDCGLMLRASVHPPRPPRNDVSYCTVERFDTPNPAQALHTECSLHSLHVRAKARCGLLCGKFQDAACKPWPCVAYATLL